MPATYDPTTDVGKVRLLISDTDTDNPVFQDDEIQAFLGLRLGNVQLAAASALRSIAGNAVMVRGKLTMLDASTDSPAEARALNELADKYEHEVDAAGVTAVVGGQEIDTTTGFVIL